MSAVSKQTIQMLEMLPEKDLETVNELLKMLVRAWDPDFSKVTPSEKKQMDIADQELKAGIYFTDDEVWN